MNYSSFTFTLLKSKKGNTLTTHPKTLMGRLMAKGNNWHLSVRMWPVGRLLWMMIIIMRIMMIIIMSIVMMNIMRT